MYLNIKQPNDKHYLYQLTYKQSTNLNYFHILITVSLPNNEANLIELYCSASILVETNKEMMIDLPEVNKLSLIEGNNCLMTKTNNMYPCFVCSGTFDIIFYIEDGMGYLGAFLSE